MVVLLSPKVLALEISLFFRVKIELLIYWRYFQSDFI